MTARLQSTTASSPARLMVRFFIMVYFEACHYNSCMEGDGGLEPRGKGVGNLQRQRAGSGIPKVLGVGRN